MPVANALGWQDRCACIWDLGRDSGVSPCIKGKQATSQATEPRGPTSIGSLGQAVAGGVGWGLEGKQNPTSWTQHPQ